MISFACTGCGKNLQVKDEFAARKTKCPKCGAALTVPTMRPSPQIAQHKPTLPVAKVAPPAPSQVDVQDPPPVEVAPEVGASRPMQHYKQCPYCGEQVLAVAKKCKHCGETIDETLRTAEKWGRSSPGATPELLRSQQPPKGRNKNITIGSILILLALVIAFFTFAHRPVEGFMDAMQREGSFVLRPQVYYSFLFFAAVFGLAGVLRIVKAFTG